MNVAYFFLCSDWLVHIVLYFPPAVEKNPLKCTIKTHFVAIFYTKAPDWRCFNHF